MGMGEYLGCSTPATIDLSGSAGSQRQDAVRCRNDDVECFVMEASILVMRVTQVMCRVDQWLVEAMQCMDQVEQLICRPRVETEMQMEDVELAVMSGDPLCVEGRRGPPLRRRDARAHDGIG